MVGSREKKKISSPPVSTHQFHFTQSKHSPSLWFTGSRTALLCGHSEPKPANYWVSVSSAVKQALLLSSSSLSSLLLYYYHPFSHSCLLHLMSFNPDSQDIGLSQWLSSEESACQCRSAGNTSSIPGSRRSPGGGHGNPLQSSCLENPVDRGAWRATVHRVTKSRIWLKRLSTHMHGTDMGVKGQVLLFPLYRWGNWGLLRFRNSGKVIRLERNGPGI